MLACNQTGCRVNPSGGGRGRFSAARGTFSLSPHLSSPCLFKRNIVQKSRSISHGRQCKCCAWAGKSISNFLFLPLLQHACHATTNRHQHVQSSTVFTSFWTVETEFTAGVFACAWCLIPAHLTVELFTKRPKNCKFFWSFFMSWGDWRIWWRIFSKTAEDFCFPLVVLFFARVESVKMKKSKRRREKCQGWFLAYSHSPSSRHMPFFHHGVLLSFYRTTPGIITPSLAGCRWISSNVCKVRLALDIFHRISHTTRGLGSHDFFRPRSDEWRIWTIPIVVKEIHRQSL